MTLFLLIRHGDTDAIGRSVPGRMPGVELNENGRKQAKELAERLAQVPIHRIYASPMERTRQTAQPLAERLELEVRISEALNEVDYGEWTGRRFDELEAMHQWHEYNRFRAGIPIPNGESFLEIEARMLREMRRIHEEAPGSTVALVSHADPIKSALCGLAGISADKHMVLEISPASVSVVAYRDDGAQIGCVNRTNEMPGFY